MLIRCILWIFIVFSLLLPATLAHAAAAVGTIVEVEGSATVTRGGKAEKAAIDAEIYLGDIVATGAQSRVFILLVDDTEWTLSENTKFRVSDFVFDPGDDADNAARYDVLEGAFRYVSGLVAKKDEPDVRVSTPYGAIGIRGTDFTGAPQTDGGYGVYVDEGAVNVENAGAATLLKRGEGARIGDRKARPGRAERWSGERIAALKERVRLKRQQELRARIAKMRPQQMEKRKQYAESLQDRLQDLRRQRGQKMQQHLQERREKWQDKMQQRRQYLRRHRYNQ